MKKIIVNLCVIIVIILGLSCHRSLANPVLSRVKRISDQRLAELETLIALDKLKGKLITVPVGMGINPASIGRKRRADDSFLKDVFNTSEELLEENEAILETEAAELKLLERLARMEHAGKLRRSHDRRNLHSRHSSSSSLDSSSSRYRGDLDDNSIKYIR